MKRREFVKTLGATGIALYSTDLVSELLAQSVKGDPLQSKFKGLSDIALNAAKQAGCTYADVRFTRSVNSSVNANGGPDRQAGGGGGGFGGGGGGGFGRGGSRGQARAGAAGFGIRVIHSGV